MDEYVNDNAANDIADRAIELITEEFQTSIRPSFSEILKQAKELEEYAEYLHKKFVSLNTMNNIPLTKQQLKKFTAKAVMDTQELIKLTDKALKFQNSLNKFLGQSVVMTFVYRDPETKKLELWATENTVDELTPDKASESHGGTWSNRYRSSKVLAQQHKILLTNGLNKNSDTNNLLKTAETVYDRADISKSILALRGAFYILWKENGEWEGTWVSGMGPLGESYLKFFIEKYKFPNQIEPAVKEYMMNKYYGVVTTDNESGFLSGDWSKDGLEFGVKAEGATALSNVQIVDFARQIASNSKIKTEEDLYKIVQAKKKQLHKRAKRNMTKIIKDKTNNDINTLINEYIKKYDKK